VIGERTNSAQDLQHGRADKADAFDYIEIFYNPKRRHSFNNRMLPREQEKQ